MGANEKGKQLCILEVYNVSYQTDHNMEDA